MDGWRPVWGDTMGNMPPALGIIGIGWYFATCIVLSVLGGLWLDDQADTEPLFAILGVFVGLAVAGWGGYRMLLDVVKPRRRS